MDPRLRGDDGLEGTSTMPHLPDFEAWAIFAKVADRGSFSGAAAELALSKATVSKAVSRLEARLGAPLFHRTSRRIALTESGRASLDRARRILAEGEAVEEEMAAQAVEPRGIVRMAAPLSFGVRHVAPLLPGFLDRFPRLSVDCDFSDSYVDVVGRGHDLAIRIGVLDDSSLRARRICGVEMLLVAAPGWWDRTGRPAHPRELEGREALLYSNLPQPEIWSFRHRKAGEAYVRVESRVRANNGDALVPLLIAGQGMAVLPDFVIGPEVIAGRLESVLPEWMGNDAGVHIVSPPGAQRPRRVSLLIDHLTRELAKQPWAAPAGLE
jgi:DNA-binding transcriptional LysR family regulator